MTEKEESQFKHLFTPLKIGHITVRNRIVNTAHGLRYAENHLPSERHIYYHMERAKGGVGLSIMESTSVHHTSISYSGSDLWNHDDSIIPYYERLAEAVHKYGGRMFVELNHAGRQQRAGTEYPLVAPSSVPTYLRPTQVPRELELEQISEIADAFGKAALRCKQGGLDGAELHGAHGNLIEQFLSPMTNRRTDAYGGSLENRLHFAIEVLEAVRKYVGSDFVVGMRINGSELTEGGLANLDMQEIAWRLEQTGLLNYFSVSMGHYLNLLTYGHQIPDMSYRPGVFVHLAAAIKKVVKIPVFTVGRINHPVVAEQILASGQADMVGMVRALIADPHLPNKAKEGKLDDIRFCVGAMEGCIQDVRVVRSPVTCVQNPITGREKEWATLPEARVKKKVVVVGGGPAGLEAARVAALRGHKVTLFEKGRKLGGQILVAAKAPVREELAGIVEYQARQVEKLGVDVKLGVLATADAVLAEKADAVVIATGAQPAVPEIVGADSDNVVNACDVLDGKVEVGNSVLVFDEIGDQQAFGAAEYLATKGRKIEFVTRLPYAGINVTPLSWRVQFQRMLDLGINFTPFSWVKKVEGKQAVIANDINSAERVIEGIDTVVLAVGSRSNDNLYYQLKGKVPELHLVGDAVSPRGIQQAVYEGQKVARVL